ncbi:multiple inositol polyphosphate phosphatase 1-like isoform X2 [Onthophagus taurus]|uniref:multiple inositol polyphosphate phosphatase 1-like isoform X2 n=1 Tax=Onthophagus taurus TaxID=166361 RepID=UPI000C2072B3|nr:multiple inositol polyphosphate phosphatase 1-like isoform X2 [Onthophagus taurus]
MFHLILILIIAPSWAQYDPYGQKPYGDNTDRTPYSTSQYDRDRQQQYDRDRQQPYDNRDRQYDRDRDRTDQYGQPQQPYDRDRYNYSPYDRNRTDNYDRNRPDYDRNRQDYDRYNQDRRYGQSGGRYDDYGRNRGGYAPQGERIDDGDCCEDYCYSTDHQQYLKFGPKTAYTFAYGKNLGSSTVPQCRPVQFWSLNKVGANFPDPTVIQRLMNLRRVQDEIMRNYEVEGTYPGKGRLCREDFELLKRWRWNDTINFSSAFMLSQQGMEDMRYLVSRYQTKFRELLGVPYSENHYYFQYSRMDRIYDSYKEFTEGLFQNSALVHANVRDELGDGCGSFGYNSQYSTQYSGGQYQSAGYSGSGQYSGSSGQYSGSSGQYSGSPGQYSGSPGQYSSSSGQYSGSPGQYQGSQYSSGNQYPNQYSSGNQYPSSGYQGNQYSSSRSFGDDPEIMQLKQKPDYKDLTRNIFRRLGYRYVLNDSVIDDMYEMCRLEKAFFPRRESAWCSVFNKKQLDLLEYAEDLRDFLRNGYGNEQQNKMAGCQYLRDMYVRFQKTIDGYSSHQKVAVTFATADSIQHMLVAMGLYRDYTPLSAQNYYTQSRRRWKTSEIAPFAANFVAVLYECDPSQRDMYKVMFYLNENPVDIPECSVGLCSWETIRSKYQDVIEQCRHCSGSERSHVLLGLLSVVVAFFTYQIV